MRTVLFALLTMFFLGAGTAFADGPPDPELMRSLAQSASAPSGASDDHIVIPGSSGDATMALGEPETSVGTTLFYSSIIFLIILGLLIVAVLAWRNTYYTYFPKKTENMATS